MAREYYFIRISELRQILGGVSRSKIERDVAAGILPKPYKLGKRTVAWRSDEIDAYLDNFKRIDDAYANRNRKKRNVRDKAEV